VGHGDNKREEMAVRGDRIHWIQRPKDLKNSPELDTSILLLLRKIESLVFGIKNGIPALDLRNVTSTQLAIFVGLAALETSWGGILSDIVFVCCSRAMVLALSSTLTRTQRLM
jgi:hypothetical protein